MISGEIIFHNAFNNKFLSKRVLEGVNMKKSCLFAVFSWLLILGFLSCELPTGSDNGNNHGNNNNNDDPPTTTFYINLSPMENGSITVPDQADEGDTVTLEIYPEDGYLLVEDSVTISKAGGGTVNVDYDGYSYSFVMPGADVTISAEFEQSIVPTYQIQIGTFEGGSVRVNITPAPEGKKIRLTIDTDEGWELENISVTMDDAGDLPLELSGEGGKRYFLMPPSDVTVNAGFVMTIFDINIDPSVANGGISADVSTAVIGTTVTLTFSPDVNFVLMPDSVKVNDGTVPVYGSGDTYEFVMPASDVTVMAEFADTRNSIVSFIINGQEATIDQEEKTIVLELEYSSGMNLTGLKPDIDLDSPAAVVSPASQAPVNFTNPVEYKVTSQSGDVIIYNVTVTIKEPEIPVYYVNFGTFEGGSVSVNLSPVEETTELCLSVSTEEGWKFQSISIIRDDDGVEIIPADLGDEFYFYMPPSDVTVSAVFTKIPYDITIASLSNGSISAGVSAAGIGTTVNLTISPDAYFALKQDSLKVNNGSITVYGSGLSYYFTMPAFAVTVTAQFVDTRNSITSFSINGKAGIIDQTAGTIIVELDPFPVPNVTQLAPVIVLDSSVATVSPASGVTTNFSNPVNYSVTSESESVKTYTVTVNVLGQGTITINGPRDEDITFTGVSQPLVLSQTGIGGNKTVTVTVNGTYSNIQWYIDADQKFPVPDNSLTLDASLYDERSHSLTVVVFSGSTPYSKIIPFTVKGLDTESSILIWQAAGATDGAISHSFVELYNLSDTDIPLTGYTLQYSSSMGAAWEKIDLTGTIMANRSYFILGNEGTPNPDIRLQLDPADPKNTGNLKADMITNMELSNRALKVALIHSDKLLAVADPFTADGGNPIPGYVDMIGAVNDSAKDTIDAFEGTVSEGYSKQKSLRRNSFTDTNNNSADFDIVSYNILPVPHIDAYRPRGTAYGQWDPLDIPPLPPSSTPILILQAGSAKDGAFSHSFVELYNPTDSDIVLTGNGYTLQYSSAVGTNWEKIDLTGTIKAKHSFFVLGQAGKIVVGGVTLPNVTLSGTTRLVMATYQGYDGVSFDWSNPPTPVFETGFAADMVCPDLFLSNDQFKVVLIQDTVLLEMSNPYTANGGIPVAGYIDMLGAVNTGKIDAFEGSVMPKISKQQTARRETLNDTDNNANDFISIDYRAVVVDQYRPRGTAYGQWNPCP